MKGCWQINALGQDSNEIGDSNGTDDRNDGKEGMETEGIRDGIYRGEGAGEERA